MQTRYVRSAFELVVVLGILTLAPLTGRAEGAEPAILRELRTELERLKTEQVARMTEMQRLEARLIEAEASLSRTAESTSPGSAFATPPVALAPALAVPLESASKLHVESDFRVRYENNSGDSDAPDWTRGVLRARLRAEYHAAEWLTVGGQLATGDPDDPNSTDVTLSNFLDDLDFSLDQAYVHMRSGNLDAWGGKFALPFVRSDLVWDGDVSPQGLGAVYRVPFANGANVRLAGLYFLVDHSVAGGDSSMIGAQIGLELPLGHALRLDLSAAEYDYSLASVAGADAGDFRSNVIGLDGRYVSEFDLLDGIVTLTHSGFNERWPLRISAEYAYNRGARVSGDTGYAFELSAGRIGERGDWRFGYAYSMAEVDAVLAAFSHDNTTIGSNYLQHSLFMSYSILDNLVLDTVWYRYRPKDAEFAGSNLPDDWLDRLRLNLLVSF